MKIIFSIYLLFLINYLSVNAASNWARGCGFVGNDLTNARVEEEDCGPLCEDTPGCTHFTWSYKRGGTCWMKYGPVSRLDAVRAPINLTCGVIDDWQESQPSLDIGQTPNRDLLDPIFVSRGERAINWPSGQNWMMGCDFFGNDLSSARTRRADCGQRCATTARCTHYTWTSFNGGTCWMKQGPISKDRAVSAAADSVCGVMAGNGGIPPPTTTPPPPPPRPEDLLDPKSVSKRAIDWKISGEVSWSFSCDFQDKSEDYKMLFSNAENCGPLCYVDSRCTHFTWTSFSGGTCWLKKNLKKQKFWPFAIGVVDKKNNDYICGFIIRR